jgi:hypothetical protein
VDGARPVEQVPDALANVFATFAAERRPDEPFHAWARRRERGELRRALSDGATSGAAHGPANGADAAANAGLATDAAGNGAAL